VAAEQTYRKVIAATPSQARGRGWRCGKPVRWLRQNSFAGPHDERARTKQAIIVSWGPPW
jgi:hypothetical protein